MHRLTAVVKPNNDGHLRLITTQKRADSPPWCTEAVFLFRRKGGFFFFSLSGGGLVPAPATAPSTDPPPGVPARADHLRLVCGAEEGRVAIGSLNNLRKGRLDAT